MRKKKLGRKRKNRIYFGQDVEDAIIEYNQSNNHSERNRIYQEKIHHALDKLAENIINTFKFSYFDCGFDDVKQEVVSFMVMNLHKYDASKGFKAFSYFSVVAKNYLILVNNSNYKKYKITDDVSVLEYFLTQDITNNGERRVNDLMLEIIKYFEYNIPILFGRKNDVDVAFAIVEIMKRRGEIENFNKKSLYILIREMTNVKTARITNVMNVFKDHYQRIISEFELNGIVDVTVNKKDTDMFF